MATLEAPDIQLVRWYQKYNRLYFGGKLHAVSIWYEVPSSGGFADCQLKEDGWQVRINPALAGWPQLAKLTLLHELVHIRLHPYKKHGKKFNAEMLRLAQCGALNDLW